MIIMVLGLPGSGKSYFAERLAKEIDAEYLNSDKIRKEIVPERTYSDKEKALVYKVMLNNMLDLSDKNKDVVLDASFYCNEMREPFLNYSKTTLAIIEVWVDEDIIKQRLKKSRPYSEADFKVYQLLKQQWEPLQQPHLILESGDIGDMLSKAVKYLKDVKKAD